MDASPVAFEVPSMLRARTTWVVSAACLVWVGGFQADSSARGAEAAVDCNQCLPQPAATFVAVVNPMSDAALSDADVPQWRMGPARFGKRLAPLAASSDLRRPQAPFGDHLPALNWVSSYLPDLEFCTVLSRFRF